MEREYEKRISEMEVALRGDMKTTGLIQHMMRVMDDLYKEPHGLRGRMDAVERKAMGYEERAKGAAWLGRVIWSAGGSLVGGLVGMWLKAYVFK